MNCRAGCGACCIAPSISSPMPGAPLGKAAAERCLHLAPDNRCNIFNDPRRPAVCGSLQASAEMCGSDDNVDATRAHAMHFLTRLERDTRG